MDHDCFDAMTRAAASLPTRRSAMRLIAGGALSMLAARLGLAEDAAAKQKHRRRGPAPRKGGGLQAEGKRKKKRKKPQEPPPLPPGCRQCNECEMCQDGVCVPDVDLEGVRCQGSGADCGYCQFGRCAPSVVPPCEDGVCPRLGQCCPDEKRCRDRESASGWACLDKDACCPDDERRCASGCVDRWACCPEDRPRCGQCGEICVNGTWRCSAQKPCADGSCVAQDECCPDQTGTTPCGDDCCEADETCLEDPGGPPWIWRCCPDELNIRGLCCDRDKTVCGPPGDPANTYCCQEGTDCCEGRECYSPHLQDCCNGKGWLTELGPWSPCGDENCCRSEHEQCCNGYCCPKNALCCGDGHCCPNNRRCCGDTCCLI